MLTYVGPPARLHWLRLEPLLPAVLTLRDASGRATRERICDVQWDFVPPEGLLIEAGRTFTAGRCAIYPWGQSGAELAMVLARGLYLSAWEDRTGVHAETLRLVGNRTPPRR